ncbi:MAG: amino acid adenylation domain-containing protein [Myxococcota bacterium]
MSGSVEIPADQLLEVARRFAALPEHKQQAFLERLAKSGIDPNQLPLVALPRPPQLPLSHAQERLWFLHQLDPSSSAYNLAAILRFCGELNVTALEASLRALMVRHESLRTVFGEHEGKPTQRVEAEPQIELVHLDISELPVGLRFTRAAELSEEESHIAFDLCNGPPLRLKLLRLEAREHWLLITLHHIIADEWSEEVLTDEFVRLYEALQAGRRPELPALDIQYADYALWQRTVLAKTARERDLAYWKQELGGADVPLLLPTDRPRPVGDTLQSGAEHSFAIDAELMRALRRVSEKHGVTLFTTVLAAYHLLLSRYTGETEIRVGTPVAGRTRLELEPLIGLFANTVVLRSQVNGQQRFADYLKRLGQTVTDALEHQELPFEELVEEIRPERRVGQSPLFQVMFSWHRDDGGAEHALDGLEISQRTPSERISKFDLTLHVTETLDGLAAQLIYRSDLFDAASITRLGMRFTVLLRAIVSGADLPIARLAWLDAGEQRQTLALAADNAGESTLAETPEYSGIHVWIAAQASRHAARVAVRCEQQVLSYAELESQAERLASTLIARGVRLESRVALCLARSCDLIVALYAVLKAGAAYVPLDPKLPVARQRDMLLDSGAELVLCHEQYRAALNEIGADCLVLEQALGRAGEDIERASDSGVTLENAAYVIYTSGSTGRPKGVVVTHRGITSYVRALLERLSVPEGGSIAMVSTIAADLGNTALFGALCSGRTLHLVAEERLFDPDAFADYMREHAIDAIKIVPSHLAGLLKAAQPHDVLPRHTVIVGGEVSSWSLVERVAEIGSCQVLNHYGPTETTVGVLTHAHTKEEHAGSARASATLPLGRPLSNSRVYVLNADLQPMPVGIPGELYIGGQGVARGYLGRADLSAERFIPDPFACGERLYRTGDRARYLERGEIEFLGRRDNQVKIRGFRVELGEIRAELLGLPEVSEAEVALAESQAGITRFIAYLVPAGANRDSEGVAARLAQRLPEHMLPSDYVWLDRFPLTENGKLDRRALPLPAAQVRARVLPRTELEERLAQIWREVLKRDEVGVFDNFFMLGGDSILTLQVIALARKQRLKLTPKQFFAHQTIAELASAVELLGAPTARSARDGAAERRLSREPFALTPVQRWFFGQNQPEPQHWNQSVLLELGEPLDRECLRRAVALLVEHHEALRLRFRVTNDEVVQSYAAQEGNELCSEVDLSAAPDSSAAIESTANAVQRSLDLEKGPVFRAAYLDLGPLRSARLLLVAHHLVVDGVSWRILLEDLRQLYAALRENREPPELVKTASFQEWSQVLERYARAPALHAERAHWQAVLADSAELPARDASAVNSVASARTLSAALSVAETRELLGNANVAYRTRPEELLLTALALTLCEWAKRASMLIQLEGHGREDLFEDIDLTRSVGWFTTLFPVRLEPVPGLLGASLLAIKEQLRQIPNKGLGYGVLRYLGADRAAFASAPPARVSFNYWGQVDAAFDDLFRPAAESGGEERSPQGLRSSWFEVSAMVVAGRLDVGWTFSSALHDEIEIARLVQRYLENLRGLLEHCSRADAGAISSSDFPLARLSQAEIDSLPVPARRIEDIYPLSPLQQGLLFHSVRDVGTGVYINQRSFVLNVALKVELLRQAFRRALQEHEVLRSLFLWQGFTRPFQVVLDRVDLPIRVLDWRSRNAAEQQRAVDEFLEQERTQGFELGAAPLMRIALVRLADERYHFVWTCHHLLLDGWSSSQLLAQVFLDYMSLDGAPPQADATHERGARFREYIAWLERRDPAATQEFWSREVGAVSEPSLLAERTMVRKAELAPGSHYATLAVQWPAAFAERLTALAQRECVTLNTLFQAAIALVLGSRLRQRDLVLGITVSGRSAPIAGIEHTLGLFINTLPLRIQLRAEQPLGDWLRELQANCARVQEHEAAPLVEVQKLSAVPRGTPLFDTLFVFENYPVAAALDASADTLRIERQSAVERTNYPLTIAASPGDGVFLELHYDQHYFDARFAGDFARHLQQVLRSFVEAPEQRVHQVSQLTPRERATVVSAWNATTFDYPERCVHQLFEAHAARAPESLALIRGSMRVSYGELNTRANRVAHRLRALGVHSELLLGIVCERSIDGVVALLASLKAGAAYLPIDPSWPRERIRALLRDAGVAAVLTQEPLRERCPDDLAVHCVEALAGGAEPSENLDICSSPDQLAYCIYTSGSTGRPKASLLSHRGLVSNLCWTQQRFGIVDTDRVAQLASWSFDASVWELWLALTRGAACVLPRHTLREQAADELFVELREQGANVSLPVPSLLAAVLESATGRRVLAGFKGIFPGAERLPPELARMLLELGVPQVVNLYGPTEASIDVTAFDCRSSWDGEVPIGKPIGNMATYVLDEQLSPLPVGVVGEVYAAGVGLARGYLGRPDLTAERFLPNPFSTPGGRMYRTGDLGYYRADGQLNYCGRSDQQVKIRGHRVELAEIERRLREQPEVKEAVVLARADAGFPTRLVAYVVGVDSVAAQGSDALTQTLGERLALVLPEYLLPSGYVVLSALPLGTSGKLDRSALPVPEHGCKTSEYVAPSGEFELTLTSIYRAILRLERVGIHDDFFALGGDSILALQLVSRAKAAHIELTPKDVFEQRTVHGLSRVARRRDPQERGSAVMVTGDAPLTPIQHWFFERRLHAAHHWNQSLLLELVEALDLSVLSRAVHALYWRHAALRLRFEPGQRFARFDSTEPRELCSSVDLSREPDSAAAIERVANRVQQSLDLEHGPLLRVVHLDVGADQRARLLIVAHHLVVDAVSFRILLEDLEVLYRAFAAGLEPELAPLGSSWQEWARALERHATSETLLAEASYWQAVDEPTLGLPATDPHGENTVASARVIGFELDAFETEQLLGELARAYRADISSILLTALAFVLCAWSERPSVVLHLEGHGREDLFSGVDVTRSVGWFTSLYPVRLSPDRTDLVRSVSRIKEQLRSVPQRGIGYGILRHLASGAAESAQLQRASQPQIMFNYLGQFDQTFEEATLFRLADEPAGEERDPSSERPSWFEISAAVYERRLRIDWRYSEAIHSASSVGALVERYRAALTELLQTNDTNRKIELVPSDFRHVDIAQSELDDLLEDLS